MFERKILVADKRSQYFFHTKRELLSHTLERYNWDVRVLYVGPNEVFPVRHLSVGLIGFENSLESVEVREQDNAVEVVAEYRDLAGARNRLGERWKIRHAQILTQLLSE